MNNIVLKKNLGIIFALFSIYQISLALNYVTPLMTDDFTYMKLGTNLVAHYNHYMGWSGRVVADMISTLILSLEEKNFMSLANAIPLITIPLLICIIAGMKESTISIIGIFVAFIFYILFNPSLGQTTFWIVGSANYLWTSMFALIFILILYFLYYEIEINKYFLIVISLLAGCSNESTAISLVMLAAIFSAYAFFYRKSIFYKVMTCFIPLLLGTIILVAAPGNRNRLTNPDFSAWRQLGIIGKMELHIFDRIPAMLENTYQIYLLITVFFLIMVLQKNKPKKNELIIFVLAPVVLSIFMVAIMVASPYSPPRAANMSLIVVLIPIIYLLSRVHKSISVITLVISAYYFSNYLPLEYMNLSKGLI
ncbi:DUF6056 family protein [Collimonas sp. NPDC087041]|uniref:DUF6056 family protein n=1 Tax=Collimonas sp. NPDC087041 TaxID=3363960 RepID=UPI00381CBE20